MREFGDAQIGRNVPPMCTMYDSDSLDAISEIGAKLVFASVMRDVRKVDPDDELMYAKAQDPLRHSSIRCCRGKSLPSGQDAF